MKDKTTGPLSRAEFEAIFQSVNDPSYSRPFIELGEGKGYEAHTQGFEQMQRLSASVDRTTQSMFLLPFSGQTDEPAQGGSAATVTLTFARSIAARSRWAREVTLPAGLTIAEEIVDMGPGGGVIVETGRRFVLTSRAGIEPGNVGPVQFTATAEQIGGTYNNVGPGDLTEIIEVGAGFTRGLASVVPGLKQHLLILDPNPDVISAQMVGNYVEFTAGVNTGQVRRIVGYRDPNVTSNPPDGGIAILGATGVYHLSTIGGTFLPGEIVEQVATGASAIVVFQSGSYLIADRNTAPNLAPGFLIVGVVSGAVAICDVVDQEPDLLAEPAPGTIPTATWRVLSWVQDFGISVTNEASPDGGRAAMLDELVGESEIARASGETDEELRERGSAPNDLITPGAVLRAANRVLVRYGVQASLREVGMPGLPGLYFDGDLTSVDPGVAYAFDLDFDVRPQDAYKLNLDYIEFRAFFLLGVPPSDLGEFGVAFDSGSSNAFDAAPWLSFMDGFPLTAASIYRTVWQEVSRVKAGGVGFDLVLDTSV